MAHSYEYENDDEYDIDEYDDEVEFENLEPRHDLMPLKVRQALYMLFIAVSVATPFMVFLGGHELANAWATAAAVLGTFAGATALANPTRKEN